MKITKFSNGSLESFFNNLSLNQEIADQDDRRLRAIKRKEGFSLGIRLCINGQRKYVKLATWPQTSVSSFKKSAKEYVAKATLDPKFLSNLTLNQAFDLYWEPYSHRLKDPRSPKGRFDAHIRNHSLGRKKLASIAPLDIETRLFELHESGLAPATVNKVKAVISKVFSLCIKADVYSQNPCKHVQQLREFNTIKTVWNLKETKDFIEIALQDSSFLGSRALLLSLMTGARIGEVIAIRKSDVNDEFSKITLHSTKNGLGHVLFLNDQASRIVRELYSKSQSKYLFPSKREHCEHITPPRSSFKRILNEMAKRHSLDCNGSYTIHMLRRTFICLAHSQLKDLYAVSRLANHQNPTSTLRYLSIYEDEMGANAQSIGDLFTGYSNKELSSPKVA